MDHQQQNCGRSRRKVSLVERDEFFNKILSRNPSLGYSSRVEYYRSSEGVPFNWEKQPGTPKHQPIHDTLPPLSPPPAQLSLALPKPCINFDDPKPPLMTKLKFWKQKKKTHEGIKWVKAADAKSNVMMVNGEDDDHKLMNFYEICSSDGDHDHRFSGNNCSSSNSSSSESFSFSVNENSLKSSSMVGSTHDDDDDDDHGHDDRHDNDVDDHHTWHNLHGCGPWTSVLVRAVRRER
ncbi:LOW QUALITY PROTEIN: uncharacterized protein LOC110826404 [Carica papaya]|uniref:LOW QUALITY PROTEIN: uncharacterized protein LOC110826404 n=1 Tax=Carica papaya TaxID=3649 RepID=UPI000B8CF9E2|nr:LOW QUALITY PROTEIN: uncharacterized protein LOC110826404 [Carica papaya]